MQRYLTSQFRPRDRRSLRRASTFFVWPVAKESRCPRWHSLPGTLRMRTSARRWYRENVSTRNPHALIVAQKMLQSALSGIGFDPAGRSKLGVAEVRRVTTLEDLMSRRAW